MRISDSEIIYSDKDYIEYNIMMTNVPMCLGGVAITKTTSWNAKIYIYIKPESKVYNLHLFYNRTIFI